VTAYKRVEQTLTTLQKIQDCVPLPDEILVHVDGNEMECVDTIRRTFPDVKVLHSETNLGPGGARNKLIAAANNEIITSFDDDSFPIDKDYFARVIDLFKKFSGASIICGAVYHQGERIALDTQLAEWVSDFSGGACAYRRSEFLAASGYVPLPVAYGMEEVDLALRLHSRKGRILKTTWLRVFHDTDLKRHASSEVTAGSVANIALLAYLRYPPSLWFLGVVQCLNRILWLLRHGRTRGILRGIAMIPKHLHIHRQYRHTICAHIIKSYLTLRRAPISTST
jgi:GT2 family glycosyltransferase